MEHAQLPRWFQPGAQLPVVDSLEPECFIPDLAFEEYLSMRTAVSSTGVRTILKSPRHFLAELIGLNADPDAAESEAFRFGRAAHLLILEPQKFKDLHVVAPNFLGLTKDGRPSATSADAKQKRAAWQKQLHPSAVVISQKQLSDLEYMVDELLNHPQAANLLRNGRPEVSGLWNHPSTGVRCRIRPDYLTDLDGAIYISDIKTTRDASAPIFANDCARYRYYVQLAFYADGVKKITGKAPEAVAIIAVQKTPPYSVALYWLSEDDLARGRQWYEYALATLKRCILTGDWPSIQRDGQMMSLPKWTDYEMYPQFDWKR